MSAELERAFPRLIGADCAVTSPQAASYNCIAWAAGESHRWWQPGAYWPGSPGDDVNALVDLFTSMGYETCERDGLEVGREKIAIYADERGDWTHAARQWPDGSWTSKLGPAEDITHQTPAALTGILYGEVRAIMR